MRWTGHVAYMAERRICGFWWENFRERDH